MSGPVALADTANKAVLRRRLHIGAICEAWLWNCHKLRNKKVYMPISTICCMVRWYHVDTEVRINHHMKWIIWHTFSIEDRMLSMPGCPYTRNNQMNMFSHLLWRFHMSLSALCSENEKTHVYNMLTHWGLDKWPLLQTTLSSTFSWKKITVFWHGLYWSLLPRQGSNNDIPALVQAMAWHRTGNMSPSEPKMP